MNDHPSESVTATWVALHRSQAVVLGAVEADLKREGLPPLVWYDVLLELRRAEPDGLRSGVLEQRMLLAQYNMSRLADRLGSAGYLRRSKAPNDGRGTLLMITAKGRELLDTMWPAYGAAIQRHVGDKLTKQECVTLRALLTKLREP